MFKFVYLDQNAWICLLREYEGKMHDVDIKRSLEVVLKASENGDAVFPLSLIHLKETSRRLDQQKRDRFFDFLFRVSKGYAIVPFVRIIDIEINQVVRKQVGLPTVDLKCVVVGKGLPFILGARAEISKKRNSPDIPASLKKALLEKVESPETLLWCMKSSTLEFRKGRRIERKILETLENIRKEDMMIKDKDLRRRINMAKFLVNTINPKLAKFTYALGLDPELVIPKGIDKEQIEKLFQNMPSLYTTWVLTYIRDNQSQRKIDKNDLRACPFIDCFMSIPLNLRSRLCSGSSPSFGR